MSSHLFIGWMALDHVQHGLSQQHPGNWAPAVIQDITATVFNNGETVEKGSFNLKETLKGRYVTQIDWKYLRMT